MPRRRALGLLAACCGTWILDPGRVAAARTRPGCPSLRGRRVSWLVGWSPGGGYDIYSRLIETSLERILEAEVVVENVPGASGIVAARRISTARPDGRTLGILNGIGLLLAPYTNLGFAPDLEDGFTVLGRVVRHQQALVVGPGLGVDRIEELVRVGRTRPLILGATGPTTVNVLLEAMLGSFFGIEVRLVLGFPGSQELLTAVLRGDLDGAVIAEESAQTFDEIRSVLRFSSPDGSTDRGSTLTGPSGVIASMPELFPDPERARLDAEGLAGLMAVGRLVAGPPRLPPELRDCLGAAIEGALADEATRRRASSAGRTLEPADAREVLRHIRAARLALPRYAQVMIQAVERAAG
ncbi:MAG: tripartite tricarboxylate transporter substrate-binding protein [Gemmatimonadota bacterium]